MKNWPISNRVTLACSIQGGFAAAASLTAIVALEKVKGFSAEGAGALVSDAAFSLNLSWFILAASVGAAIALNLLVVRSINLSLQNSTDEVRSSADQVSAASSQVASASEQLAQSSGQQAASLQETSASGQEISVMTQRTAENSQRASELMVGTEKIVKQANHKLEGMVTSMGEITQSSERIAKIIKVIDEIAFQTNILALNAAVEAARAGEAGMGFAVVADEVRNLAQRCAQAAKDTTVLIEESVVSARTGSTRLDEVGGAIRDITADSAKVKILVDEISQGGLEQARGIDQISRALVQMEHSTQQSAANAAESASAGQELKAQAESMQHIVATLEGLSGNRRTQFSRPPVRPAAFKKVVAPASSSRAVKTALAPLRRAIGTNRPLQTPKPTPSPAPAPVPVSVGVDRSSFPLDESEFREF